MCGLVHVIRKDNKPAYKSVLKRYRKQQHRGKEGFGYVAIKDNKVVSYQRTATEKEIIQLLEKEDAPEILFHHRSPTGTPNIPELAHPFLIEGEKFHHQYFVAHNGVIRNHEDLKKAHKERGIEYMSEMHKTFLSAYTKKIYHLGSSIWNDSEALAVETALVLDGHKYLINTLGPAAVIGLQTEGTHVLKRFFYRNQLNPLRYHEDSHMITITSSGHGEEVEAGPVFTLDLEKGIEKWGTHEAPHVYEDQIAFFTESKWDTSLKKFIPRAKVPLLPSREVPPPWRKVEAPIGFKNKPDIRDNEPDYGLFWNEDIADIISNNRKYPISRDALAGMTVSILWDEYEKANDAETTLKKEIQKIDSEVEERGDVSDAMSHRRLELADKLENVQKYIKQLDVELTIRESVETSLAK